MNPELAVFCLDRANMPKTVIKSGQLECDMVRILGMPNILQGWTTQSL